MSWEESSVGLGRDTEIAQGSLTSVHPGVEFRGWDVQDFIGRGATGVVYRAYSEALARPAAIKVLHNVAPGSDASARFRREAQAMAQLRHPNIATVYDYGESAGSPYMVVQYLPGGCFADRLGSKRPLPREGALRTLREIASALDHAHAQGVVHRDVKPANVLVDADGSAVLADFGLAKLIDEGSVKTLSGVTTGTPAYMAPEQVTGGKVGPAADRYALATMAYEMVTGHLPFELEGVVELLYAQAHRPPPPPSTKLVGVSRAVDSVLLQALAKDPQARWGSATEMVEALAAALESPSETGTRRKVRPARSGHSDQVRARPGQRRRLWLTALAMLPILAGGIVAFAPGSQEPNVGMMNTTVQTGDYLLVAVHHANPNQPVEVVIGTGPDAYKVTLMADRKGEVNGWVAIPHDLVAGEHVAQLCIDRVCRPFAIVQVTAAPVPLSVKAPPDTANVAADSPPGAQLPTAATDNPGPQAPAGADKAPASRSGSDSGVAAPSPGPTSSTAGMSDAGKTAPADPAASPASTPTATPTEQQPGPLTLLVGGSPATSVKRGSQLEVGGTGFDPSR